MDQLKLIWELEKHNCIIEECKKNLTELENSIKLKNLGIRINELEFKVNNIKEKILDNNKYVVKLEKLLKEYDYTKDKLEKDLYGGAITDIKQLNHLTREKEGIISKIDDVELRILEIIDEIEELHKQYNGLKDELDSLNLENLDTKNNVDKEIKQIQIRIRDAECERSNIIPNIDNRILDKYEKIRNKKGKGIVLVNNYICSGCNMRISSYLMKDLKKGNEIVFCESCGRILYYIKERD